MAHLWIALETGGHGVLSLENTEHELPFGRWPCAPMAGSAATLVRVDARETWALIVNGEKRVRINGAAISAGLAVLADRDEIIVPGAPPLWFSTETVARIDEAPSLDGRALVCPRCRLSIAAGSPAVSCPNCRVRQHQTEELPCFTFDAAPCPACGERFELDGDFRWSPEDL